MFDAVVVSTESPAYAEIAIHYGAEVPCLRPQALSGDASPDIEWVAYTLQHLRDTGREFDCFSILRPTSPLRTAATIRRGWETFLADPGIDSLRAVEPCSQHPGKMWRILGGRLVPVLPVQPAGTLWHSRPTQSLPEVWVQNASLEMAWTRCVSEFGSISGEAIAPFQTLHPEGLDLNDESDWRYVLDLVESGRAELPAVGVEPWVGDDAEDV